MPFLLSLIQFHLSKIRVSGSEEEEDVSWLLTVAEPEGSGSVIAALLCRLVHVWMVWSPPANPRATS